MPFTKSQRRTKNDIPTEINCRPSTYFEEEYLFEKKNQIHYAVSQSLIPKVQIFITILFFVVHIKVI